MLGESQNTGIFSSNDKTLHISKASCPILERILKSSQSIIHNAFIHTHKWGRREIFYSKNLTNNTEEMMEFENPILQQYSHNWLRQKLSVDGC